MQLLTNYCEMEKRFYQGSDTTYEDTELTPNTGYAYTLVAINNRVSSEETTVTIETLLI
ncbi:hypothetical protein [Alkalihalobacillus trypoxylicola]|uniref:hypothetical protein n=1 Tax=Alkalihalobacillus trypoxylicola TaxID=519424 RepID=UPI000AB4024E|nr:hypothetical protein [Alkalihalobacillus trypoxylicola]